MLTQTTYRRHPSLTREWERYNHSVPGGQHAGDYITGLAVMLTLDDRWSRVSVVVFFFVCLSVFRRADLRSVSELQITQYVTSWEAYKEQNNEGRGDGLEERHTVRQASRRTDGRTGWRSIAMARSKVQSGHSQPIHMDLLSMQWALSHI